MRKPLVIAAISGLTLISAHPPQSHDLGPRANEARSGYPPCSRTVTDRCIQLYERGVRAPANLARNSAPAPAAATSSPVRQTARLGGDEIDVTYAGNVLQTPPRQVPAPAANPAAAAPAERSSRVVVVRQGTSSSRVPAHAVRADQLASASTASAYPACRTATSDRCLQQPRKRSHRQVSMRVKRAGERG